MPVIASNSLMIYNVYVMMVYCVYIMGVHGCLARLSLNRFGVEVLTRAEIWFKVSDSPAPLADSVMMSTLSIWKMRQWGRGLATHTHMQRLRKWSHWHFIPVLYILDPKPRWHRFNSIVFCLLVQALIRIALILHRFELRSVNRCICSSIKRIHTHP